MRTWAAPTACIMVGRENNAAHFDIFAYAAGNKFVSIEQQAVVNNYFKFASFVLLCTLKARS